MKKIIINPENGTATYGSSRIAGKRVSSGVTYDTWEFVLRYAPEYATKYDGLRGVRAYVYIYVNRKGERVFVLRPF